MPSIPLSSIIIILLLYLLLILLNTHPVSIQIFFWEERIPLLYIMFFSTLVGIFLGILFFWAIRREKNLKERVKKLREEISQK